MEQITCNVASGLKEQPTGYQQVTGYMYTTQGISMVLHVSLRPSEERQYTCSEYYSGHAIAHGTSMQDALDKSFKLIDMQTKTPAERVALRVAEFGYANPPS